MFNKILTVVLLSSFVFLSHATDKNVNCIQATRESRFPYGDEVARADFCVRLSDILTGFVKADAFSNVCALKNDDDTSKELKNALNATQLLDIEQDPASGEWQVKTTSAVTLDDAYAKPKEDYEYVKKIILGEYSKSVPFWGSLMTVVLSKDI